ncbi:MAG: TolC family protein, partial [Bacteroidia bacterium]|nr:TolC family protein [Bacteroidia bacterium]
MKKLALILYIILLMPQETIHSQEIRPISKNEVFELVDKNNASIKISEQEYYQAKADFRQTNAVLLPNISVSHTGIATTNPLMAFGSKLNQEILTNSDFDPNLLNNPNQIKNFATKIEVLQPIINMDGIYQRRAAKNKMEAQEFQIESTKDYMAFEVEKAYMQLQLAYKAVDVLNKALEAALANRSLAENSFKQGYLQKTDVLAVEVRVTEVQNQLQNAKSNIKNSSEYLSFLINDTDRVQYKPTDSLAISVLAFKENSTVSEQRADIKAMKLASNAYQTMHKADKLAFLPNLNAFGSYELYDNKIFQTDASGYLIGAQLSWNIFEGSKRFGKIQKSKAEYEKSRLQYEQYISQSNMEFNKAKRMLYDAEN